MVERNAFAKLVSKPVKSGVLYCVKKKLLNGIVGQRCVHVGELRNTRKIYPGWTLVCQRQTVEHERRTGARLDPMGNGGRAAPESQRGSEFSMESANDKIRARPFRHTKFQNVSVRFRSSHSERVPPFPAVAFCREHKRRGTSFTGYIHHLHKLAVFNFHERFRIPDAFEKKSSKRRDDYRLLKTAQEG